MGYVAPTWQNGGPPALNAQNMQDISDNLAYVSNHMVNPNLLDNWYFGNPVNQRGQTSYSGSEIYPIYAIDRWKSIASVSVLDGGITVTNVVQPLEASIRNGLRGKTVTASCLLVDGTLVSGTAPFSEDVFFVSGDIRLLTNSFWNNSFQVFSNTAKNVLAVKLELGSQQTLAHQENGVWVLNEIPKFGDQLAECQRYFEWMDVQFPSAFNGSVPYRVVKRATPVFTYYSVNGTVGKISQYNSSSNAWDDVEPTVPPTDLNLRSLVLFVANQHETRFRVAVSADL